MREDGLPTEQVSEYSALAYLKDHAAAMAPLFIARAGRDEVPGMDASIDRFVAEALARNAPITLANHPQGVHGFDSQTDDERSREIVRQVVEFLQAHLGG